MNALLLLLLDSRAPAGAHHHSGGMEAAVMTGLVTDLAGAEDFGRIRLRTSARVSAAFAAASCRLFLNERGDVPAQLTLLDIEYGARIPSEATRRASRELGRGLSRLLRSVIP
jgi:urease accessory protein